MDVPESSISSGARGPWQQQWWDSLHCLEEWWGSVPRTSCSPWKHSCVLRHRATSILIQGRYSSFVNMVLGRSLYPYESQRYTPRARKSRYWGEMLLSYIHCCNVTKPPYLLSGELCTSPLHSNRLFVYTVCCRRRGQCFSVLRTRHTDVVGDSSGRSYVIEQWHNVQFLRTCVLHTAVDWQSTVAASYINPSNSPSSCSQSWQLSNSPSSCDNSVTSTVYSTFVNK